MGAFEPVSTKLAGQLQPPSTRLPPNTRLSLSSGRRSDHIIVQLAPQDIPSDEQRAAPAIECELGSLPARRSTTAAPQSQGQGTSAAAVQAASDRQQATQPHEQAAEQHDVAGCTQQQDQNSSAAKRCRLAAAVKPAAGAGRATGLPTDGSAHAPAVALPRRSSVVAASAAAVLPRRESLLARPLIAPAAGEHPMQPPHQHLLAQPLQLADVAAACNWGSVVL